MLVFLQSYNYDYANKTANVSIYQNLGPVGQGVHATSVEKREGGSARFPNYEWFNTKNNRNAVVNGNWNINLSNPSPNETRSKSKFYNMLIYAGYPNK